MNRVINEIERMFPNAKCELNHSNEFELVIAVMLSSQTTDAAVNKLTNDLFKKYIEPTDYLMVSDNELESDLRRIGLHRRKAASIKAASIKAASKMIINDYSGVVPNTRQELMKLPGVGRKTANVVLGVAFDIPAIPVDTHVERVSKRLGLAEQDDNVLVVEKKLMGLMPKSKWNKLHHQMIFFGRYHCLARKPHWAVCKFLYYCNYLSES